jgi:NADPH-dependent 2,4-dienoyl-CoA reductase/sulfur reductase-like enzyme/ferredoxin
MRIRRPGTRPILMGVAVTGTPQIEVRQPGRPPRRVAVERALEIGREGQGVRVADDGVSRRHAKLLPSPLGLSLVDLGSRNGTLLNGRPVTARTQLTDGDVIRIGRTELIVLLPPDERVPAGARVITYEELGPRPAPPPRPVIDRPPGHLRTLATRVFAGTETDPVFRTYQELPRRVPITVWRGVRVVSVASYVVLILALLVWPTTGLTVFFGLVIPILPALFWIAPGIWRNICPLSSANQSARVLGFTLGRTAPRWVRERGYLLAMGLFFGIAGARLAVFNDDGTATAVLLAVVVLSAFGAGVLFQGKSGWCSSICPLLPLQRVYGQTPFVLSPNSHCQPCLACTRNCFDFQPQIAQQADLHDTDPRWSQPRRLFASALPGFVLGFFTVLDQPSLSMEETYARLALFVLGSVGGFVFLETVLGISSGMVTALWGAVALHIFYWFSSHTFGDALSSLFGLGDLDWLRWPILSVLTPLTLVWLVRTYWSERRYLAETATDQVTDLGMPMVPPPSGAAGHAGPAAEVAFVERDGPVAADAGQSVLEIAEGCGLAIEAGCRMGVCGSDPVAILEGAEHLSEPEDEERSTLRRLGLAPNTRMACCARVQEGAVSVSLTPERGDPDAGERPIDYDRSITSVVVLGTGIAGVTAADFVRRGHPDCEIHLVGQEPHLLYNRMGISRIVYGRSAMSGLYLLDEQWYDDHRITTWLNTLATEIDVAGRSVLLGTGQRLFFDRLILATGSRATTIPLDGFGLPGTFVLRQAEDATRIRGYTQQHGVRAAVVAGGGLLGLEAAHSLHRLGLKVTVLELGDRLLARNIDERASELVHQHFARLGIEVRYQVGAKTLEGSERLEGVRLDDGSTIPAGLFLICIGITPATDLAKRAGIAVERGVLVDDLMRTSAADVYAAGDVAQHHGLVLGLWPVATKQAEIAAINALGGAERLPADLPAMILKGVDLDLSAVGRVDPAPGDELFTEDHPAVPSYRRLLVKDGVVVGVLALGSHPEFLAAATTAVKRGRSLDGSALARLRAGDWSVVKDARDHAGASAPGVM